MMSTAGDSRDSGVTLVELMISMVLTALAVAIIATTLGLAQRATNRIETQFGRDRRRPSGVGHAGPRAAIRSLHSGAVAESGSAAATC